MVFWKLLNFYQKRPIYSSFSLFIRAILLSFTIAFLFPARPAIAQARQVPRNNDLALLDSTQQRASTMVIHAASWLDDFFNDARATNENNRTRIRLKLSLGYSKNDSLELKPSMSGRIDLPSLSKKIDLLLFASNDKNFQTEQNPISSYLRHQGSENHEVGAALQYFFKEGLKYNISTTLGASFQYIYAGVRYRYTHDLGTWQGRFINRIQYFTDDGWEDDVSYDIEHHISEDWLFRTTVGCYWYKNKDGLPHSLVFGMYQILSNEKAILYELGNYFDTKDSYKMTDLQIRVRYRQRFLRDWLILEIAPQVTFPESHDREANPGLIVKLEADIGNLSGRNISSEIFSF